MSLIWRNRKMISNRRKKQERVRKRQNDKLEYFNPDDAVLKLMNKFNDVPSDKRPVYFYLYFPNQDKAKAAEEELINLDFLVDCIEPLEGETDWLCLAEKSMLPSLKELTPIRNKLERLAQRLSGKYDGWETEMFPGNDE